MQASYGLYVWPSAPILAWYLYEHRQYLPGKRVLELGAGTALPGVVAALLGAQVTLSDSAKLPHCLDQCERTARVNGVGDKVKVIGLTWGLFLNTLTQLKGQVDLLLGSDCFYDPSVFEDLISTVAYILEHNPQAKFLTTYQERSADWSIEHLLKKWGLNCKHVPLNDLSNSGSVDLLGLMQDHTIHLLEITHSASPATERSHDIEDIEFS
ncbi:Methyltransferase-like protein 23 [Orchesella cincta]|uniref:Methyltransferase-like protein 23 n=1 Tax=Orchesella cincta TaxID=48709 RepID=A0A1D2MP24_ORCCI|nr:Methyltransferase-like protein 23 [Orchesella cincta]